MCLQGLSHIRQTQYARLTDWYVEICGLVVGEETVSIQYRTFSKILPFCGLLSLSLVLSSCFDTSEQDQAASEYTGNSQGAPLTPPPIAAKRMHDRIASVPPSPQVLDQMTNLIAQGKRDDAARIPMQMKTFYDITLADVFKRDTNVEGLPTVTLNDYATTLIGMVRDDIPFNRALFDDILYIGTAGGIAAYSNRNNDHYSDLEDEIRAGNASLKDNIQRVSQVDSQATMVLDRDSVAGVITTRASSRAFFSAGTNRRVTQYVLKSFVCKDIEDLRDATRPDYRVRRDVDRSPGGNPATFKALCASCHAGMDALSGAWAYYDDDGNGIEYTPGSVQGKMNINGNAYPDGFRTTDDSFLNLWSDGTNSYIGWNGPQSGSGAQAFGRMVAATDEFPRCMAKRMYKKFCLREPDEGLLNTLATQFKENDYNMKKLIIGVAAHPDCF